jgi:hypothetical protein
MTGRHDPPKLQAPDSRRRSRHRAERHPAPPPTIRGRSSAELETHDAFVRVLQDGRVRVTNPETAPPGSMALRRRSPETSLSTKVPEYIMQQLRRRYADTGITIRNQILLALRRDGLAVEEDDLQDERKRRRG